MEADASRNWTRTFRSQWKTYPVNLQNEKSIERMIVQWTDAIERTNQVVCNEYANSIFRIYCKIARIDWKSSDSISTFTFFIFFFWRSHPSPGDNCAALYRCVQELVAKSTRLQVQQNRFRSGSAQTELPTPPSRHDPGKWTLVGLKLCCCTIEAPTVSLNILDGLAALMVLSWTAATRRGQKMKKKKKNNLL